MTFTVYEITWCSYIILLSWRIFGFVRLLELWKSKVTMTSILISVY